MKKTIIIYYSLEGNCDLIAQELARICGADLLRLETVKSLNGKSWTKFFWGGMQVTMGKKPELKPYLFDKENYDKVILGSPIWAGRFAPAIYTFMEANNLKGMETALFCCHAGGKGKAFDKIKEELGITLEIPQIDFTEPLKNDKNAAFKKIDKWIKQINYRD